MKTRNLLIGLSAIFLTFILLSSSCLKKDSPGKSGFVFGADLSYVNQVLDHGGIYLEDGHPVDPYELFSRKGANVVRLRLWHDPQWTREVYEPAGTRMYSDIEDVSLSIRKARDAGMAVCLDIHYSDTWADAGHQVTPDAWNGADAGTLRDSVYQYTYQVINRLNNEGLMPEMVQIGNEINGGMLFPLGNWSAFGWKPLGDLINAGIRGVRDASASSAIKPKVILHIAQPENVSFWFNNITQYGGVSDFDIIGFSYYTKWSRVAPDRISTYVSDFRKRFGKEVMIVETAYPWTGGNADSYNNIYGPADTVAGYPATPAGQLRFLTDLTREVKDGGGMGIMVWEPAWITSSLHDLWGTGSSWDNCTFFDFGGNLLEGIRFMQADY